MTLLRSQLLSNNAPVAPGGCSTRSGATAPWGNAVRARTSARAVSRCSATSESFSARASRIRSNGACTPAASGWSWTECNSARARGRQVRRVVVRQRCHDPPGRVAPSAATSPVGVGGGRSARPRSGRGRTTASRRRSLTTSVTGVAVGRRCRTIMARRITRTDLVGVTGFEPVAPRSQSLGRRCGTGLLPVVHLRWGRRGAVSGGHRCYMTATDRRRRRSVDPVWKAVLKAAR